MLTMRVVESSALEALGRLAGINTKALHKGIAKVAELQVKQSYPVRWMRRRKTTSTYSAYARIKEYLNIGSIGFLTHSSYESIRGISRDDGAEVGMFGRWPNRGFLSPTKIPIEEVLDFSRYESGYKDMPTLGVMNYITVWIDSSGMHIKWPKAITDKFGIEDRTYKAEDYSTKKFGVGPGTKRKYPVDVVYLDDVQTNEIYSYVDRYIDRLMGAEKTKRIPYDFEIKDSGITEWEEARQKSRRKEEERAFQPTEKPISKEDILSHIRKAIDKGISMEDLRDEINVAIHTYGVKIYKDAQEELNRMIMRHFKK